MKQKHILLLVLFLLGFGTALAQENIIATGGNATGSGGTISYTIGQVFYTNQSNNSGTITPGVQQPFEISNVTCIDGTKDINLFCSAYPNPITDFLTLKVEYKGEEKLFYHLFNIIGNLLESNRIGAEETTISMVNHLPAIYLLKITEGNKTIKTFKIIKK